MPASLLHSQFELLEEPGADEHPIEVSVEGTLAQTVTELLGKLAGSAPCSNLL